MRVVWAPTATDVSIEINGSKGKLTRSDNRWWCAPDDSLNDGDDYRLWIDGRGPFPDPRSAFQPGGVHGASRFVDHSKFSWTDKHWQAKPLPASVIYEMHVGTFTPEGTFEGAIERLDHLVNLGVTHLELMPVAEFLGDHGWGYDGVFPFAPHHAYGGPDGLKRLVNECHRKGLAVLLDVVYNHFGPSGNYAPQFGPYFTQRHSTPWGNALNFDGPDSDEVRQYFIDNAVMWLRDYHIDGLRLDAVHAIVDLSAVHFLEELATEVDEQKAALGRHLVLIAESDLNDPRVVRPWELGGFGLDAQWSDDVHHALHAVLTKERSGYYADFGTLDQLATALQQPYVYAGQHSEFRRRRHGRPPVGLTGNRFVAFSQNHDQLGNRARGERLCHLAGHERMKIGAALILLSPYVPLLFQGEEWGASAPFQYFVDFHSEPELAAAVDKGRREEFSAFAWDVDEVPGPSLVSTFERSKIDWDEVSRPPHEEMLTWYRQLIRLRAEVPAFTTGRLDLVDASYSQEEQWLRVERGDATILCNFCDEPRLVQRPTNGSDVLLSSKPLGECAPSQIELPPVSVTVFGPTNFARRA